MARRPGEPGKKEATHERIVAEAARALRREGYGGVRVAEIMNESGLTHGGFYAHFASRDALIAEAAERATQSSIEALGAMAVARSGDAGGALAALAERYLSDAHTARAESGCALAALASETPRQAGEVRAVATRNVEAFVGLVEGLLPGCDGDEGRRDEARVLVAALVGALVLARAVDDPDLSRELRGAVKRFARRRAR
ncbi:MAG TPA: TetR/AcrR family transcriptional regulator [Polyangiaceae bacterium]|nr:TetR/AcrR family transcriptional regulator [Polyangiaceae bacterium]